MTIKFYSTQKMKWPFIYKEKWEMRWHCVYTGMTWHYMTKLPPSHHSNSSPKYEMIQPMNNYLQIKVTFLVALGCIQVEEWFATRGTHQPHSQVHFAHMSTDCSMWGWWSLFATLKPASVYSFDAPQLNAKGLLLCNPNFICSRIISILIWALYISSTHSHLYQRW